MKKQQALLFAVTLLGAQALFAEYPRDAAARFKMKHGISHPVAEQEKWDRSALRKGTKTLAAGKQNSENKTIDREETKADCLQACGEDGASR